MKKYYKIKEEAKLNSAIDHSNNSRNSPHGYLEMGNHAEVQAKQRALHNNDNTTENVTE